MAATMLRCKESFSYDVKGVPVVVPVGALRASDHRDVKGREALFETVDVTAARQRDRATFHAETATAAPGQARVLTHPGQS